MRDAALWDALSKNALTYEEDYSSWKTARIADSLWSRVSIAVQNSSVGALRRVFENEESHENGGRAGQWDVRR